MSARVLDGKTIAAQIRAEIQKKIAGAAAQKRGVPGLAVVLAGENPASQVYVRMKKKACEEAGFYSEEIRLPSSVGEEELLRLIRRLNEKPQVHGILVQLPLPSHIHAGRVLESVDPAKDVDCFHPYNVGKLLVGEPVFAPCTPAGVMELLRRGGIETQGRHAVILGRSNIVGKPMAALLMAKGADATVTVCHSQSRDLPSVTRQADILIAAIGRAEFVKKEMVREGAAVIDVGINRVKDASDPSQQRLVGDVDYAGVSRVASHITPVPGGVGPMTIAMLLANTLKAFELRAAT